MARVPRLAASGSRGRHSNRFAFRSLLPVCLRVATLLLRDRRFGSGGEFHYLSTRSLAAYCRAYGQPSLLRSRVIEGLLLWSASLGAVSVRRTLAFSLSDPFVLLSRKKQEGRLLSKWFSGFLGQLRHLCIPAGRARPVRERRGKTDNGVIHCRSESSLSKHADAARVTWIVSVPSAFACVTTPSTASGRR